MPITGRQSRRSKERPAPLFAVREARAGIATFTSDICEAVAVEYPQCECVVGAVNDRPDGYDYPPQVRFEIGERR